jgi:hypothetical protein
LVPSGDASPNPHCTPSVTPASLMAGSRLDRRIAASPRVLPPAVHFG